MSRLFLWVKARRPLLTALFVLAALGLALWDAELPTSLLRPGASVWFGVAWVAMLAGVGVRIWGAGNLHKNQEITDAGIYRLVRHPLYLGSLLVFLAFFVTVGNPVRGLLLFLAMVVLVYYPTMMHEEENLARRFPEQFSERYRARPRLIPNPLHLPDALETDRFSLGAAYRNLGVRSLWILVLLPALLELLRWVERRL